MSNCYVIFQIKSKEQFSGFPFMNFFFVVSRTFFQSKKKIGSKQWPPYFFLGIFENPHFLSNLLIWKK